MRFAVIFSVIYGMALAGAAQEAKTQWDGIFTARQAKRGEVLYNDKCSTCHGVELTGGNFAPALTGTDFNANWNDLSLSDLFERIRITMPQENPGSLSGQQSADVLAYLLLKGNYPAANKELPAEAAILKSYTFVARKP